MGLPAVILIGLRAPNKCTGGRSLIQSPFTRAARVHEPLPGFVVLAQLDQRLDGFELRLAPVGRLVGDLVDQIHRLGEITSLEHTADGTRIAGRATEALAGELAAYAV